MSEIYEKLCAYDERNYVDLYECNEQPEARRKDCMCDNCFYGRDKLAREIIILREALEKIRILREALEKIRNTDPDHHTSDWYGEVADEALYRAGGGSD